MKIRNGFVSNSSSSSFIVYGVCGEISEYDLFDIVKYNNLQEKIDLGNDTQEILENISYNTRLDYYIEDDCIYLGFHPDDMRDDELLNEFKNRVEEFLKPLAEDFEFSWYGTQVY